MKRNTAREIAVQLIFMLGKESTDAEKKLERFFDEEYFTQLKNENELFAEYPDPVQKDYILRLTKLTAEHRDEIDGIIEKYAHGWKLSRLSGTALAVLRCAVCEVKYIDEVPDAVAINEAVEIAKGYDDGKTVSFINGVLGGFMRGEG